MLACLLLSILGVLSMHLHPRWDVKSGSAKPLHKVKEFSFNEPVLQLVTQGCTYAALLSDMCVTVVDIATLSNGTIVHDGGPAPLDGSAHTFSIIFPDGDIRNSFFDSDILDMVPLRKGAEVRAPAPIYRHLFASDWIVFRALAPRTYRSHGHLDLGFPPRLGPDAAVSAGD